MADDGSQPPQPDSSRDKKATADIALVTLNWACANASKPTAPPVIVPPAPASSFKPPPATLPPGSLEAVLHALLRAHGARVYEDHRIFWSFMADGLVGRIGEHQLAVNTMALLVEEGLPLLLIAATPDKFTDLLQREAARVALQHDLKPEVVVAAASCWAAALRPELGTRPVPRPSPPPPTLFKPPPPSRPVSTKKATQTAPVPISIRKIGSPPKKIGSLPKTMAKPG